MEELVCSQPGQWHAHAPVITLAGGQHTWHLAPYLQLPVSSQDRHSSVCQRDN